MFSVLVSSGVGWAITTLFLESHGATWEANVKLWEANVKLWAAVAVGAFGISTLVGAMAGLYPSNKAAKLTPVEALRFD